MTFVVGMLIYPQMTNLDFAGPIQVFAKLPDVQMHILWKEVGPVETDACLSVLADTPLADCPRLDLLFVPGGPGQVALMDDREVIAFLAASGAQAQWVTSVCTGALLLGAAGLLSGYQAATHWSAMEQLPLFGAEAVSKRVVRDRNRITGGGVTAGIDFGLRIMAQLQGEDMAQRIQLGLEYNPEPPFVGGSPDRAPAHIVAEFKTRSSAMFAHRLAASQRAAERLRLV